MKSENWRPISTAPKDGREILGYQRGWCINGGEIQITQWWESFGGRWVIPHADWNPTHWMPLPDPPAPTGRASA